MVRATLVDEGSDRGVFPDTSEGEAAEEEFPDRVMRPPEDGTAHAGGGCKPCCQDGRGGGES